MIKSVIALTVNVLMSISDFFLFVFLLAHLYLISLQVYNTISCTICQQGFIKIKKFSGNSTKTKAIQPP